MGKKHANFLVQIVAYNLNRFGQVAVIADDYRGIIPVEMAIVDHMCSDIDVRAFFLSLNNFNELGSLLWGFGQHHTNLTLQELPVDNI